MSEPLLDSENSDELLGGRYLPVRQIGSGGSGIVYEAVHHLTRERVAVKVIMQKELSSSNKRVVARFMREAKLSHRIQSDGVVRVTDAWIDSQKRCCLVMELLRGMSLREVIHSGRVARGQVVSWLIEALDPLEAAHRASIIHRDLKPENIYIHIPPLPEGDTLVTSEPLFLDEERGSLRPISERNFPPSGRHFDSGFDLTLDSTEPDFTLDLTDAELHTTWRRAQVKLLDFGLSRSFIGPTVTQTGHFVGTPWYMSPEQIFVPKTCTHVTDLWSVGVMLYEVLNDDVPFKGDSMPELCLAVRDQDVPPLREVKPGLPPELLWCVDQCLHKDPKKRIQSAAQLKYNLEKAFRLFKNSPIAHELVSGSLFKTPSTGPSYSDNTVEASQRMMRPSQILGADLTEPEHQPVQILPEQIEPDLDFSGMPLSQVDTRRDHHLSEHQRHELLQLAGQFNSEISGIRSNPDIDYIQKAVDQRETVRLDPQLLQGSMDVLDRLDMPQTAELTSGVIFEALAEIDQGTDQTPLLTQQYTSDSPQMPRLIIPDSVSFESGEVEITHTPQLTPRHHVDHIFAAVETPLIIEGSQYTTGTQRSLNSGRRVDQRVDQRSEPTSNQRPGSKPHQTPAQQKNSTYSLIWLVVVLFCFGIGVGIFIRFLGLV
jgi:serine/threonine protein kinase